MRRTLLSMESIAFQSTAFFRDLTKVVEELHAEGAALDRARFYKESELGKKLLSIIHGYTGLNAQWDSDNPDNGPAMYLPYFTVNHIFIPDELRESEVATEYIDTYLKHVSQPYFKGTISLMDARVTGDFCKLPAKLLMPYDMLTSGNCFGERFTAEEIAAIILHEVGHAFTTIEYADRMVTTNQILAAISMGLRGTSQPVQERIWAVSSARLKMTAEQRKALTECKTEDGAALFVATVAMDNSRSELGASVFDVTSCEQLADQFAARHGASKPLMTALEKISHRNLEETYWWRLAGTVTVLGILGAFHVAIPLTMMVLVVWMADKKYDVYGSFHSRISRIRGEIIQRLKETNLSKDEKFELVEALDRADKLLSQESDKLEFLGGLVYYLKTSFRSAHKYELLQRQLEAFASNGLFGKAAKLSML